MRIVVVDPSRTVLKIVARLLEADGHEVIALGDGREAVEYIKSDPDVGVLITSAELTSMSGMELCWEVRVFANSCRRPIHIILMSANRSEKHIIEALDSGADDFIGKPPVSEELYARLRCAARIAFMQRELVRLATTDPLTGLLNRRAFFEQAQEAYARARTGGALSAIMLDADHFKRVNDSYGHDVGDDVLRAIGRDAAGENMVVGRLGGEEFAILLEDCSLFKAAEIAECLRVKISGLQFETKKGPITVTCSFGVSEWTRDATIDQLLKSADAALYAAKSAGRNRVVAADPVLVDRDRDRRPSMVRASTRA
jgi:two-component system, cell cycle response regulator